MTVVWAAKGRQSQMENESKNDRALNYFRIAGCKADPVWLRVPKHGTNRYNMFQLPISPTVRIFSFPQHFGMTQLLYLLY